MDKPTVDIAVVPGMEVNLLNLLWEDTQTCNFPCERHVYIYACTHTHTHMYVLLILSGPFQFAGVALYGNCPDVTAVQSAPFLKKKAMIVLSLEAEGGIVGCHFMDDT